jgi:putative PIN family toxin of toxin-antitoxin system
MSERVHHVFDTNTLVSALLFEHSKPGQALRRALRHGHVLLSVATLEELAKVLQREKFERYVTAAEREEFLVAFVERALFIEPTDEVRVCRDAKDDKFLELTVSGKAAYIISGMVRDDRAKQTPHGQQPIEHYQQHPQAGQIAAGK